MAADAKGVCGYAQIPATPADNAQAPEFSAALWARRKQGPRVLRPERPQHREVDAVLGDRNATFGHPVSVALEAVGEERIRIATYAGLGETADQGQTAAFAQFARAFGWRESRA